jgi:hypothetical protein
MLHSESGCHKALEARNPKVFYKIKFIKITPFTVEGKGVKITQSV